LKNVDLLAQYMPPEAAPIIAKWIDYFHCEFKISKNRATKLGDYRHPFKGAGHRISVNHNLNAYAFLVTTVHEFAHLLTWNEYKNLIMASYLPSKTADALKRESSSESVTAVPV
jgi:SprT protein